MWKNDKWFLDLFKERLENIKDQAIQTYSVIGIANSIISTLATENQLSTIIEELKSLTIQDFIKAWFEEYENIKTWIEGSNKTIKIDWETIVSSAKQLAIFLKCFSTTDSTH